jgi:hypothetical protein
MIFGKDIYPALWSRKFERGNRDSHQHDAFSIAAWLSHADRDGTLSGFLMPDLTPQEHAVVRAEGWILGTSKSTRGASG